MKPEFNLSFQEKTKIKEWKQSLPIIERKYNYKFLESDKYSKNDNKLYICIISTSDGFNLVISEDVEL